MKLNRKRLRKLIMEVLNENESPNENIAAGDALYKHFRNKIKDKKLLNSHGFGFRQNAYVDTIGFRLLDSNGEYEASNSPLKKENITYVYGFLRPGIISSMAEKDNQKISSYNGPELRKYLQEEVDKIANQYNVDIKIGFTDRGTRYTAGDDKTVYTINRIN